MGSSKISVGSNAPPTWAVLLAPLPFIKHVIKYKYDYPKTVADPWRSPEEIYKEVRDSVSEWDLSSLVEQEKDK